MGRFSFLLAASVLSMHLACSGDDSSSGAGGDGGSGGGIVTGTGGSGVGGNGSGGNSAAAAVCTRWQSDRADMAEGTWSGDVAACNAGDVSADGRANAVKLVNLFRYLAGLPPVTNDPARDAKNQACALMMHANGMLSHTPPTSWTCYSGEGAEAAGSSNIASGPGVMAVDMYMSDFGNEGTMGHRRWILSDTLGPIGIGSTSGASCMWVIGGAGATMSPWIAWPPAGIVPSGALGVSFVPTDQSGWTLQSSMIDLTNAQVEITDGGDPRQVDVQVLGQGYGSTWAIRMVPNGWTSQPGHTYKVHVTGAASPIDYEVDVIDCP